MKLNFGLLGIALAQSGDDYSDERHDYSYDYSLGNNGYSGFGGSQSYSFNQFGGKVGAGTDHVQAQRLSCWNSNSLRDMVMDGKFDQAIGSYHHYNHQYGFENSYTGTETGPGDHALKDHGDTITNLHEINTNDDAHSVMAVHPVKWGYQNTNPDAKYHYGHHVSDAVVDSNANRPDNGQIANAPASFDGVVDDWRYSLRHAGCLYEAPDFFYGAETFNSVRMLTYGYQEHEFGAALGSTVGAHTMVHWVHVFNAHLHIDNGVYCSGGTNTVADDTCIGTANQHQFAVTMANPTYEGLGFINFVATYHDAFDKSTPASNAGHRFRSNYSSGAALYTNSGFWHLASTGATASGNKWHLQCDANGCDNLTWMSGSNARGLSISSFPHNQLGMDFRFNIRTLHTMGDGKQRALARAANSSNVAYSYFFYGISTIQVTFPEYVSRVNDCWRQRNDGSCSADMIHSIVVDQSAVQSTSNSAQNVNGDIDSGNTSMDASLTASDGRCAAGSDITNNVNGSNNCASWCHTSGQMVSGPGKMKAITANGGANDMCGNVLTIQGIHRTYDELHMRQFGTIQEIWVQLQYATSHSTHYSPSSVGMESPFPNVFFSAPEVVSVLGSCTDASYGKCSGYTRSQNVPYAGLDDDAKRWNNNVDGDNSARGDGFWVDDLDV